MVPGHRSARRGRPGHAAHPCGTPPQTAAGAVLPLHGLARLDRTRRPGGFDSRVPAGRDHARIPDQLLAELMRRRVACRTPVGFTGTTRRTTGDRLLFGPWRLGRLFGAGACLGGRSPRLGRCRPPPLTSRSSATSCSGSRYLFSRLRVPVEQLVDALLLPLVGRGQAPPGDWPASSPGPPWSGNP